MKVVRLELLLCIHRFRVLGGVDVVDVLRNPKAANEAGRIEKKKTKWIIQGDPQTRLKQLVGVVDEAPCTCTGNLPGSLKLCSKCLAKSKNTF